MTLPYYEVDAFTDSVFGGNPAGVCILDYWLPDATLQLIAAENNLSETAFLVGCEGEYELRWFTPTIEIDLCGHATLASAFVLFHDFDTDAESLAFTTKSGLLTVRKQDDRLALDFPCRKPEPIEAPPELVKGLGAEPVEVLLARDYLAIFETEGKVHRLQPDFAALAELECIGIIASAPGRDCDFVSRFFAPRAGVDEDPVTGSAHCTLIPYWAEKLDKTTLHARQISQRGGELFCELQKDRCIIAGRAVKYLQGSITIPGA